MSKQDYRNGYAEGQRYALENARDRRLQNSLLADAELSLKEAIAEGDEGAEWYYEGLVEFLEEAEKGEYGELGRDYEHIRDWGENSDGGEPSHEEIIEHMQDDYYSKNGHRMELGVDASGNAVAQWQLKHKL